MMIGKRIGIAIGVMIFLIFSGFVSQALAFEFSQLQWTDGISEKLERGEVISYMGYSVKVTGFPEPVESSRYSETLSESVQPFVMINLSRNGIFMYNTVLGLGESYIFPDGEMKVTAKELPSGSSSVWLFESYKPWAVIQLSPRGIPELETSVETEYNEYVALPANEIVARVRLENTGEADAVNVNMNVVTELKIKNGNLKYLYERVRKGETKEETIVFWVPAVTDLKTYSIISNVSGFDVKDIRYTANFSKTISIAPEPQQIPSLKKSANPKIYLKDYTMVSLSLRNNGRSVLKNVSIKDSVPAGFKLLNNMTLNWKLDIPPNAEWDFRYLLKPVAANKNGAVLPAATAEFLVRAEYYIIQSDRPEIIVYGPDIDLQKQVDMPAVNQGDIVTVTVTAENTGSTPTQINITDELPDGTTLVSGSKTFEDYVEAEKVISFSYAFKVDVNEPLRLPPATAQYFELGTKGSKIKTESQEIEITIKPEITPTPIETPVIEPTPAPDETFGPPTPEPLPEETSIEVPEITLPEEPTVARPRSSVESNPVLYLLLGCNEYSNNAASAACDYFAGENVQKTAASDANMDQNNASVEQINISSALINLPSNMTGRVKDFVANLLHKRNINVTSPLLE